MKPVQKRISINVGGFDGDKKNPTLKAPTPQIPSLIQFEKEQNLKSGLNQDVLDKMEADLGGEQDNLPQNAAIFMAN